MAARGLDIPHVTAVINYDVPMASQVGWCVMVVVVVQLLQLACERLHASLVYLITTFCTSHRVPRGTLKL